jgi:hypothetical protein
MPLDKCWLFHNWSKWEQYQEKVFNAACAEYRELNNVKV